MHPTDPGASGRADARTVVVSAALLVVLAAAWIAWRASVPGDAAPVIADPGFRHGLTIDPRPSDHGELRASDLVVSIDGVALDSWLRGDVGVPSSGHPLAYQVRRGNRPAAANVSVDRAGVTRERLRSDGGPLLCAVAVLILGGYAVFRRRDASAARSLLLLGAGLVAYASVATFGYESSDLVYHRALFFTGFIGSALTLLLWAMAASYLALTFPTPLAIVQRHRRTLLGGYGVILVGMAGTAVGVAASGSATLARLDTFTSLNDAVLLPVTVLTIAGLAHTLWRAWRDPALRPQSLLVVLGFAATAVGLFIANLIAGDQQWPAWFDVLVLLPLPLAVTAAILRGQFLGIRAVINRTLVYVALTALLLAVYAAAATSVGAVAGQSGIAPELVATAVVAIGFAPFRARLQRAVDNLLYGARGNRALVLRQVGERLEVATDPGDVLPAVAEAVANTLHLPYVAVRTTTTDGTRLAAERGERTEELHLVPLFHQGTQVGDLAVAVRRGEKSISDIDASVLTDIARQVAPAVRAARLVTDLAASHNRLAVAREEERARLRHDLHDRLGPHLVGLSLQLDGLSTRLGDAEGARAVATAHEEATLALDEVRRISRGLRPAELEELGLVQAIGAAASRLSIADDESSWSVSVDAAIQLGQIPPDVESAAYQIALEALTNAFRHSGGNRAIVRVGVDASGRELIIEVSDDGQGISGASTPGVGIRSMQARAENLSGVVRISASETGGTLVRARLPLS